MTKLTDEQRRALESHPGHPVPVEDASSNKVYYIVDEEAYLHLQGLQVEHERQCQEQLRALIEEGIRSPKISANEAFARLRSIAEELARASA